MRFIRLCFLLLPVYSFSKADCLPDTTGKNFTGLCTPGVTITEEDNVVITEEDKGTEIVTTTKTTTTTTTTTVTNEDSGNILDSSLGYVGNQDDGSMQIDWGGQGPASMPSGNTCGELGADRCAQITGSGNSTSTMGVSGMGTTFIINNINISDLQIDKGGEVRYSIEVEKRDAQDRIYMHITGRNGSNTVFQGTDILSESGIASGYQSYSGSFDFSGVLNRITVEVGGRDINLAIGPLFDDVTVNVFYNVINTIITQQITTMEEILYLNIFDSVELDFVEEVFEYNDVSVNDGFVDFAPIEPEPEEVTYESVELEIDFEINFDMEFAPPPPVEMLPTPDMDMPIPINIETVENEIQMELEELPPPEMVASVEEMPTNPTEPEPEIIEVEDEAPTMEEIKEEPEMTEPEPEEVSEEPTEESQEEPQESEQEQPQTPQKEEDPKETVEEEKSSDSKVSKKEKAATQIVKKIDDKARYDDAAQTKTLIVMQILGNTKTFFDSQSFIQDANVTEYLNKTIDDQYGMLFDMAQNETMNDMVNSQWQNSR